MYGPRQLLQIVAVKRRQAEGRSLAEIQAELAGATDQTLRKVAAIPEELIADELTRPEAMPPVGVDRPPSNPILGRTARGF